MERVIATVRSNVPLLFFLLLVFTIIVLTFFKLSGTSIGIYSNIAYGDYKGSQLLFGIPRSVRGDEWMVETPTIIGQSKIHLEKINPNIGLGQEMTPLVFAGFTRHWKTFFHPVSFPLFVLPLEYGFSLRWWLRGVMLMLSFYFLIFYLTKKSFAAILGAVLLFFTPFIQWWYSTSMLEAITFFSLLVVLLMQLLNTRSLSKIIIYSILFAYILLCYFFVLYPPYQIPLGVLFICLGIGYTLNNKNLLNKENRKTIVLASLIIGVLTMLFVSLYLFEFKNILSLVVHTSYPGTRIVMGGDFPFSQFFSGFYNIQLLNEARVVPQILGGNQSEASSFFMLFPFILPVILHQALKVYRKSKQVDFVLVALLSYLAFFCTWLFLGLPSFLSKIFLLSSVPTNRSIIGVGVANYLLVLYFLYKFKIPKSKKYFEVAILTAGFSFVFHLAVGYMLQDGNPTFFDNDLQWILISFVAAFSVFLLLLQRRTLFFLVIIGFAFLSSYRINPLYRGLDAISNSPLSHQIQKIEDANQEKSRWVSYDNFFIGKFLVANGVRALDGVYLYPQLELWEKFDPERKYFSAYNRYAHVVFSENVPGKVEFVVSRPDTFIVKINPCNKILLKLNVKYFVFLKKAKYPCLEEIKKEFPALPLYFYERGS